MNIITRNGAPTIKTIGIIGQKYVDLDTCDVYECKSISSEKVDYDASYNGSFVDIDSTITHATSYVWEKVGGGSGGETYDAVFHAFFGDDYIGLNEVDPEDIVLASGGYDNIYNKIVNSDEMPKVILRWQARYGNYMYATIYFYDALIEGEKITLRGYQNGYEIHLVLRPGNIISEFEAN